MSRVEPKRNVYVGHRYVPKIFGEWDNKNEYEGLSIVTHQGNSYTSKKRVPVGIDILNEEFWVTTGNYDAQVEYYRQETKRVSEKLDSKSDKTYVDTELDKKSDKTYVDTELDKKSDKTYVDTELNKKSDKTYVDTELGNKSDKTYVNDQIKRIDDSLEYMAITPKMFNAVGDGVADDTQALKLASEYAFDNNLHLDLGNNVFKISDTVNFKCSLDGSRATIISNVPLGKTSVLVGTYSNDDVKDVIMIIPQVLKEVKDWNNSIGVEVSNIIHSKVTFTKVKDFETGILFTGYNRGNAYNTYNILHVQNNKKNIELHPKEGGWVNENNFNLQRSSHESSNGVKVSGVRHIMINVTGDHPPNNNVFYKPSIEGNVAEYTIDDLAGRYNMFISPRFEGSNLKIRFGHKTNLMFSHSNVVFYGYDTQNIIVEESEYSRYNNIYDRLGQKTSGNIKTHNRSGGVSGVLTVYDSATSPINANDNDYVYKVSQQGTHHKFKDDVKDKILISNSGRIYFNNGDDEINKEIRSYGSDLMISNANLIMKGGGFDTEHIVLGSYHLWIDQEGKLRSKLGKPTSDIDGNLVGG